CRRPRPRREQSKRAHRSGKTSFNYSVVVPEPPEYNPLMQTQSNCSHAGASRRQFVSTLGAAALATAPARAAKRALEPLSPGIKITLQLGTKFTDEDLAFAKQMG